MRAIRYSLLAMAVLAVLAVSIALLTREFSFESPRTEHPVAAQPIESPARGGVEPAASRTSGSGSAENEKSGVSQSGEPATRASAPPTEGAAGVPTDVIERAFADAPPEQPPIPTKRPGSAFDPLILPPAGTIGPQARLPEALPPRTQQRAARSGPLTLSREQQDKVRGVLLSHNIMQSPASEFPMQVGGIVPPDVDLAPLPHEISDAIPDYRAYSYVIAQNRIVIVVTEKRAISFLIPM